ncbi:MAG: DNA-binding protein [Planctomycetes bacterium]|nr:DNA-binding protein [Planctomycetota bacterium]
MKKLFLAWQDPVGRSWFVIGQLRYDGRRYIFGYTRGCHQALQAGLQPLPSFPAVDEVYESDALFPLFSNRLPPASRPEFHDFVKWLNMRADEHDPILLLSRSGGRRATDLFEVFPCPEPEPDGRYHIHFLVHGVRHFPDSSRARVLQLRTGDRLLLMWDFQNPFDRQALVLRTDDVSEGDRHLIGFCPRYFSSDLLNLVEHCDVRVEVERLNPPPAPSQFRLLCCLTGCWPSQLRPCTGEAFQPLVNEVVSAGSLADRGD